MPITYDGQEPVMTRVAKLAIVPLVVAAGGPLHTATLRLFTNVGPPADTWNWATITEATFDGYAASTITAWGTPYIDANGFFRVDGTPGTFVATDGTVTNTVQGWAVTTGATTAIVLVEAAALIPPIYIAAAGQGVTVVPTYAYGD